MLSHKWTFSLQILIVMLVLGFAASSTIAAEFSTTLSVDDSVDISFAEGVQVEYGAQGGATETVTINVSFGEVVNHDVVLAANADPSKDFADNDFQIIAYNRFGGTETPPVIADDDINPGSPTPATPADGKNFTIDLSKPEADSGIVRVLVRMPKHVVEVADPRAYLDDEGKRTVDGKNAAASIEIHYVIPAESLAIDPVSLGEPVVLAIDRADSGLRPVTASTFDVVVTLSEEPRKDSFTKDKIDVSNATAGDPIFLDKIRGFTWSNMIDYKGPGNLVDATSGRDNMIYRYLVTLTPKYPADKPAIVVKVKSFYDQEKQSPKMYTSPTREVDYIEGFNKLTIKVDKEVLADKTAGIVVGITENAIIPKDGYLVVAKDLAGSAVLDPNPDVADGDDVKNSPKATARKPYGLTYNRLAGGLPNLETFLINGGTIDVVGPKKVIISEIMWGSDASLNSVDAGNSFNSQYIELRNVSGGEIKAGASNEYKLVFYTAGTTPTAESDTYKLQDRVGTVGAHGYWQIAGKGQSGRTGVGEAPGDIIAVTPTQALISMQRSIDAAGMAADGTDPMSWAASVPPGLNFDPSKEGTRIGSPGRAPDAYPTAPTPPPPTVTVPAAMPEDIMITEIMVDTGSGRLPQWIELTNVSGKEVSLAGWSVDIKNDATDTDAIGASVSINLSGTLGIGGGTGAGGTMGKSLLLVGGSARSSSNLAGNDRVVDVSDQLGQKGRYSLISTMAFMIALVPPQTTGVLTYGDTAGNLDAAEAWDLPMSENGRSSLIRREMLDDGMATEGTALNGWVLASATSLVSGPATWYGSDEDAGTPGYDAGGPLPVELSHFRPARQKDTGTVVITWATQSELNNAGFFIKRSQQRDGEFKVINATMVPGAGTTSEKQFYTYTDTTAQPNVVYYYQIEDVSLDGNRQTLTRGIRLKGHVGAAGKATTTWGDLKTYE